MAETAAIGAASAQRGISSYRIKLHKEEFLQLIEIGKPKIIYKRKKNYIFAYDGFILYCQECKEEDIKIRVIDTIEFSNEAWST
jgi:hypothetical protein